MREWYYGTQGNQQGPVAETTLREMVASGHVTADTLVWSNGMPEWIPLYACMELAQPAAYEQPHYGMSVAPTSGLAIASMICGIVGVLMCMFYIPGVPGLAAVICGHMGMNQIKRAVIPMAGNGMCLTGLITGYLAILCQLAIIGFGIWFYFQFMDGFSNAGFKVGP